MKLVALSALVGSLTTANATSKLRFSGDHPGSETAIKFEQPDALGGILTIGDSSTCSKLDGSSECILTTISSKLSTVNAALNYLTKTDAASTYLTKTDAANTYASTSGLPSGITGKLCVAMMQCFNPLTTASPHMRAVMTLEKALPSYIHWEYGRDGHTGTPTDAQIQCQVTHAMSRIGHGVTRYGADCFNILPTPWGMTECPSGWTGTAGMFTNTFDGAGKISGVDDAASCMAGTCQNGWSMEIGAVPGRHGTRKSNGRRVCWKEGNCAVIQLKVLEHATCRFRHRS
jgi:hypothetical protein